MKFPKKEYPQKVKPKKKKSKRKRLVDSLDRYFSLYIRERDGYKCVVCGQTPPAVVIQCGHLLSRSHHSTRWDDLNAHAQCSGCNLIHEHDFERYRRVWLKLHSQGELDLLYVKWNQGTKFTESDLEIMIKLYRDKLKDLKDGK